MPDEPSTAPAPAEEPKNPFDFPLASEAYRSQLERSAAEIVARIKQANPEQAAQIIENVRKATEAKKSANEILETVFGVIATGVGFLK